MPDLMADCLLLRRLFAKDTSELPDVWTPELPSTGHCHVAALIIRHEHGGRIVAAEVHLPLQHRKVRHYWNNIGGVRLDVTWDQFEWERAVCGEEWDATYEPLEPSTAARHARLVGRMREATGRA